MAGLVPFEVIQPAAKYDAVLLDDDNLVHTVWQMEAKSRDKRLLTFTEPKSFLDELFKIDKDSPIFIDSNLGNGVAGESLVAQVKKLGFKEIHIATGYEPDSFAQIPGITSIVGKGHPFGP